jgi:hypothetical protein
LARDFQEGRVNLLNINSSYITLVPKVAAPVRVNDFEAYISHKCLFEIPYQVGC